MKGYVCREWFKGQPPVCNLCNGKGHRAADCPNKDRCQLCGSREHFAGNCTTPWNYRPRTDDVSADQAPDAPDGAVPMAGASSHAPAAEGTELGGIDDNTENAMFVNGDAVGGVESGISGKSGSAEPGPNVAGVESCSALAEPSAADDVLNGLFVSSDDDDSHIKISAFPSVPEISSQSISQVTDDSQSILCNVSSKPSDNITSS